jgi:hypothetical protein
MKPLGRKSFKGKESKHHVKIAGKFYCWWDDVCTPNKTRDKTQAKKLISTEIQDTL